MLFCTYKNVPPRDGSPDNGITARPLRHKQSCTNEYVSPMCACALFGMPVKKVCACAPFGMPVKKVRGAQKRVRDDAGQREPISFCVVAMYNIDYS